jgi:translocation and assembly module TamA
VGVGRAFIILGFGAVAVPAWAQTPAPAAPAELPPIPGIEVEWPELPPPAAIEAGSGAPDDISYTVDVVGLDTVDLEAAFRERSQLKRRGSADNAGEIDARAEADVATINRLLESSGYYAGEVEVESAAGEGAGPTRITITVTPGERYRFGDIRLTTPPAAPEPLIREALGLKVGQPIVAEEVLGAENRVRLRLPEQGYPFVEVGTRDVLLDDTQRTGIYTLPVTSGPLSRFGKVRLEGERPFSDEHAAVLARFDPGETWDSRLVEDYRQAMVATGLFASVGVRPVDTGARNPDGTAVVDLVADTDVGKLRTIGASAGYSTGEGFRLEGLWRHRNLVSPEGALTLRAVAGTQEQRTAAELRMSNFGQRDRSLTVLADVAREDREAYDAQTITLSGRLARESTPIWQKRWTYAIGVELIGSRERERGGLRRFNGRDTFFIGAIPGQLGYDRSDSLLDPTRGFRLTGRLSPEASLQSGAFGYLRSLADASAYFPATDSIVLAGRVRGGVIVGASRDRIAPSRRYYAGGGGSVRGYGFQDIGPRDAEGDPLGGRSIVEASVEARFRFRAFGQELGVVPFVDAGNVYPNGPGIDGLQYGAGIGVRYYSAFGPLRLDVATPLNPRRGDPAVAVYVSIGQAF